MRCLPAVAIGADNSVVGLRECMRIVAWASFAHIAVESVEVAAVVPFCLPDVLRTSAFAPRDVVV